jgi:TRAP-type C4-dicarboxylate transport system substrate-binding protein
VVDGQEHPLALIRSAKLYGVQKFCSLTCHTWDGHFILGNARMLQSLPKESQEALNKHLTAAALKQREDIARLNKDAEADLAEAGVSFNRPDTTPLREMLRSAGV